MDSSGYAEPACYRLLEGGERCWRPEGHEGECAGRAMDDREIITTAIEASYDVDKRGEITNLHQVAGTVLAAIEACGRVIVPVERIDALLSAARTASCALGELIEHTGDDMNDSRSAELDKIDALLAAAKDQTNG